jgi:hypothetical protein
VYLYEFQENIQNFDAVRLHLNLFLIFNWISIQILADFPIQFKQNKTREHHRCLDTERWLLIPTTF